MERTIRVKKRYLEHAFVGVFSSLIVAPMFVIGAGYIDDTSAQLFNTARIVAERAIESINNDLAPSFPNQQTGHQSRVGTRVLDGNLMPTSQLAVVIESEPSAMGNGELGMENGEQLTNSVEQQGFISRIISSISRFFSSLMGWNRELGMENGAGDGIENGELVMENGEQFIPPAETETQPASHTQTQDQTSDISNPTPPSAPIRERIVERIVERVVLSPTPTPAPTLVAGVSESAMDEKFVQLSNALKAEIYRVEANASRQGNGNFSAIALTQRIDNLANVTISNATMSGSTISNTTISGSTFYGALGNITDLTASNFTTGNATTTNLAVSGNSYFSTLTAGSVPFIGANGLLSQNNSQIFWDSVNSRFGIGTSTPYAKLSVAGEVVGSHFTATTTTDNTFPNLIATNATTTNATSTNFYSTNIFGVNSDITNATTTNATSTNFFSATATVTDFIAGNSTSTNATSTSSFATTASSTSLFSQFASIVGLNVINSTTTSATSTNFYSTNIFGANSNITNATTTSSFATTASSTSLFTSNFSLGSISGFLKATAGAVTNALVNLTTDITGILGIANGGTGLSSAPTYGELLVGNGTGYTLSATSTLGIALSDTTGTLAVSRGGTGAVTLTGILKGNGTNPFTSATSGTDYAPATSGTTALKGDGAGGFSSATLNDVGVATADYSLGSHKITNLTNGTNANDAVNYAQLSAISGGLLPQDPIATPNVIDDTLSAPPVSPIAGEAYLVSAGASGVWAGLEGHLLQYPSTGSTWIDIWGRPAIVGDRLGLTLEHGTVAGGFATKDDNLAQITNATPGSYAYTFTTPANTYTTAVNGANSPDKGHGYYYNSTSVAWVEYITGATPVAGTGLASSGQTFTIDTAITVDKTTSQALINKTYNGLTITTTTGTLTLGANTLTAAGTASVSGTNTGDETTTTTGTLINGATAKATPVDADMLGLMDSASSNVLKKLSWANLKTALGSTFAALAGSASQAFSALSLTVGSITGADALTISAGGTNQNITLTPSGTGYTLLNGNVGVGTTSPLTLLEIAGDTSNFRISDTRNAGGSPYSLDTKFGSLEFFTNDADSARVAASIAHVSDFNGAHGTPRGALQFNISSTGAISEAMRISSSGNVGIGTTNPQVIGAGYKTLEVSGTSGTYLLLKRTDATAATAELAIDGAEAFLSTKTNHPLYFRTNDTKRGAISAAGGWSFGSYYATDPGAGNMIISGNVGIGTTEPNDKLEVAGNIRMRDGFSLIGTTDNTNWGTMIGSETTGNNIQIGDKVIQYYNDIVFNSPGATNQEIMRLKASGNVGIGTTNPTLGPLQMGSGAYVTTGGVWTNASDRNLKENFVAQDPQTILNKIAELPISQWNYKNESATTTHIGPAAQDFYSAFGLGGNTGSTTISTIDPAGVALLGIQALDARTKWMQSASTSTVLTVDVAGNVGIGTTTPAQKLHVSQTATGAVARFTNGTGYCDINPTTTALSCTSDATLKKNIITIGSALNAVNALRGVNFNWLTEDEGTNAHIGFLAQEVEQILPELVSTDELSGKKAVNYIGFIPLLVEAVKELAVKVEAVIAKVAGFADVFTTKKLCLEDVCVTKTELQSLLASVSVASSPTSNTSNTTASSTPITIQIQGNNPATINVGDVYGDLGAVITAPESAVSYGIKASLNGGALVDISQINVDTSVAGVHSIIYSVFDQTATTTAERILNVVSVEPATPAVDTSALTSAITSAQSTHDSAVEGTAVGEYAVDSKATLQTAITNATSVKDNTSSLQADIDTAVTTLNTAVTTFEDGKVL